MRTGWIGGMSAALWLALGIVGCGPDPIVGKWVGNERGIELGMEFKADGTAAMDTSGIEAKARQQMGSNPMAETLIQGVITQIKNAKITWKKNGSVYQISGMPALGGGAAPPDGYLKIEGGNIVPCDQAGKATGKGGGLTRKK